MIPYGKQNIDKSDIKAVVEVLHSDFLTQGPVTPEFEIAISNYCGSKYSCAVNSASSALHISCLALGVKKGDWVWTSPISFVASSNCALHCGANIDFVDIDLESYNISPIKLEEKLRQAEKIGRLPKVLIPVHLSGQSSDMKEIFKLSKKYGFFIIEDASHAIGAKYHDQKVGSCKYSDITVFSFHPVKIITTCEGGICTTNSHEIYNKLCRYRSHGVTRHEKEMTKKPDGSWYYEQLDLGFNFRLNDLMSALGISQLKKINQFVKKRNEIAKYYDELFKNVDVITPKVLKHNYSSFHLYIIRIPNKGNKFSRNEIFKKLKDNGVGVNIHYIPIYRQPFYKKFNFDYNEFINSEKYYSEAISIPIYPGLKNEEQRFVFNTIIKPEGFQNLF